MKVTEEKLKEIFKEYGVNFNCDDIKDNVNLYDKGVDSVDIMEILLGIEEKLGVKIPNEEASTLKTMNDFVNYINKKLIMKVTEEKLKEIFKEYGVNFNCDDIKDNVNLYDQGVDSVEIMEILLGIEEKLGVKIPDEEASTLKTMNDFVNNINKKLTSSITAPLKESTPFRDRFKNISNYTIKK